MIPLRFVLPVLLFAAVAALFWMGLGKDPHRLPSALLDRPVPEFDLPPLEGRPGAAPLGLKTSDLRGEIALVNVFASWCGPCRVEHPLLMQLARDGEVALHGINYKDKPADARRWLRDLGDPFRRIGADITGRAAIEWGVYGVPETFLVDAEGRVRYKQVGPFTENDMAVLKQRIAALRR